MGSWTLRGLLVSKVVLLFGRRETVAFFLDDVNPQASVIYIKKKKPKSSEITEKLLEKNR